jgi:hypothetical protein
VVDGQWPVKIQLNSPETTVFSGLTRQDRESVFAFVTPSERSAYEDLGPAASWRIDMSMKENLFDARGAESVEKEPRRLCVRAHSEIRA